jgi:hypothetical protein
MIGRPHAQPLLRRNNAYRAVAVSLPSAKIWQHPPLAEAQIGLALGGQATQPKMRRGGLRRISPILGNFQPDLAIVFGYPVQRRSPRRIT